MSSSSGTSHCSKSGSAPTASEETVKAVTQERLNLEDLEPPVMQVLDVLCHNDLLRTMGLSGKKDPIAVTWWQRLTAHFFNLGIHRLAKRD